MDLAGQDQNMAEDLSQRMVATPDVPSLQQLDGDPTSMVTEQSQATTDLIQGNMMFQKLFPLHHFLSYICSIDPQGLIIVSMSLTILRDPTWSYTFFR